MFYYRTDLQESESESNKILNHVGCDKKNKGFYITHPFIHIVDVPDKLEKF